MGISGAIIWGMHRDTTELVGLKIPVFSYGTNPVGPLRLDIRELLDTSFARFGDISVSRDNIVFADDGVDFLSSIDAQKVLETAAIINRTERKQAEGIKKGNKLFDQLEFASYLEKRERDPSYTFRRHLRVRGGAIEE